MATTQGAGGGRIRVSPIARRLAEENNIDLTLVTGTGTGGKISQADVEKAIEEGDRRKAGYGRRGRGTRICRNSRNRNEENYCLPAGAEQGAGAAFLPYHRYEHGRAGGKKEGAEGGIPRSEDQLQRSDNEDNRPYTCPLSPS